MLPPPPTCLLTSSGLKLPLAACVNAAIGMLEPWQLAAVFGAGKGGYGRGSHDMPANACRLHNGGGGGAESAIHAGPAVRPWCGGRDGAGYQGGTRYSSGNNQSGQGRLQVLEPGQRTWHSTAPQLQSRCHEMTLPSVLQICTFLWVGSVELPCHMVL